MKLFSGVEQSDYQDVLRAIGLIADRERLREIRIWEHEQGMVVQGRRLGGTGEGYETFLLTDDDILGLMREAYQLRQEQAAAGA